MEVARLRAQFETAGEDQVLRAVKAVHDDVTSLGNLSVATAKKIGSGFATAGNLLKVAFGAVAVGGIGKTIAGFVNMNAQAEQFQQSLETVTGSQQRANQIFADLQKFAAETPFEFPELVQASVNLESFGLKTEDWINTIGDTASAMGKSVDQVTQAVLDATSGQYERLKELGIQASVEGDKLKLSYMQNGKQIVEEVDRTNKEVIGSTLQAIWNKKYEGAMKKQSRTFNGMLSTFQDNVKMTMAKATKPIFEFAKTGLDAANRFFDRFNDKRAMGLGVWAAAMSSLHTTLHQTFGQAAGDQIIGVIRGIGHAVNEVTGRIGTLGRLALDGDFGGFISQLGTDLLDLAQATVFEIPSLAVKIGKWLVSAGEDLWEKIKSKVAGWVGSDTPAGDETGGPSIQRSIPIGGLAIDVGSFLLKNVAGWAADTGETIQAWIDEHKPGSFVTAIDLSELNVAFAEGAEGNWGDAVKKLLRADPIKVTPEIELRISEAVEEWVRNPHIPVSWDDAKFAAIAGAAGLVGMPALFGVWMTKNIVPDIGRVIRGAFTGAFRGLFDETTTGLGPGMTGFTTTFKEGLLSGISEKIDDVFNDIKIALDVGSLLTGIAPPGLPNWLTDFGWINGPLDKLEAAWDRIVQLRNLIKGSDSDETPWTSPNYGNRFGGQGSSQPGVLASGEVVTALPGVGSGPMSGQTYKVSLDADTTLFEKAHAKVAAWGAAIAKQVYTATFDADSGPAAIKYTDVSTWGAAWNAATFISKFDIDHGPASIKYTEAFGWGYAWRDSVFSATFSIDTGPLGAALEYVRAVAQAISDLLPHSPAKKGPLSRPISFAYIADDMARTMSRMPGLAAAGMAGVSRHMSPDVGIAVRSRARARSQSAGGGDTYFVIERGALVGQGAMAELQKLVASGAVKVVDQRYASSRTAGRS